MTEEQARAICRELGATLSIRQRNGSAYIFVSRWLPRATAEAAGHQTSRSSGQQFDRYVGPLASLPNSTPIPSKRASPPCPSTPTRTQPSHQPGPS